MKAWFSVAAMLCTMTIGPAALQSTQSKPTGTKPPATGAAQDTTKAQDTKTKAGATADATFIRTAAMDGMAEVEHGRLASQNANNDEVKQFGQRMVDDHGKANAELKTLASQKNVTVPAELDAKHQAMQDKLSKMTGQGFDKAYMTHMVAAHKQAVTLFQREAKSGKDAEAKAFAEKTLPTLQEHLKMAQAISAKIK